MCDRATLVTLESSIGMTVSGRTENVTAHARSLAQLPLPRPVQSNERTRTRYCVPAGARVSKYAR